MNKKELVDAISVKMVNTTKKDIDVIVNDVFDTIKKSLSSGETVQIAGFGTFKVADRAARECINPATGGKVSVPATKLPKFSAGKSLKEAVK